MTNVRAKIKEHPTETERFRMNRDSVVTEEELTEALENAERITNEYFRLRARAVLSLERLSGKRRGEIAMIPLKNFTVGNDLLEVRFILEKKRTEKVLNKVSTKRFPLTDPLTQNVITYLAFLHTLNPVPEYWLPSGKTIFGKYVMFPDAHLSGRQVFNVTRECSETIWPHLNRETVAADVVSQDNSINAVFKVQETLDLKDFTTAFNYVRRFSKQIIHRSQQPNRGDKP